MAHPVERNCATAQFFVGRERELSELTAGLEEAVLGRGSLFLLSGEPGIGKTRLAKEVADLATRQRVRVFWGHAWEGGGQPAYWPWVQILRSYVRSEDPVVVAPDLGDGAVYIAQLVPELQAHLHTPLDGSTAAHLDSDNARFYLFDSVTEFLRNAAARGPLILVLDDLHAADLPSLLLLQFLATELHEMPILAIGTYRGVEARRTAEVGSILADLARGRRIAIGGLAERDIARLIEKSTGIVPSPELVSAVHRVTEGNPFFADEIVRLLAADGRLHSKDAFRAGFELPDGVREAIRRRLAPLPQKSQDLLTVAAVAGHEFDARLLQVVSDRSIEQVIQVLDEAAAAGVVDPVPAPFGRFRFSHALIRETLYQDIPSARRQRLHRSIGEILEKVCARDQERHVAGLAHHFCQAGVAEKAVDYTVRSARRAMRLLAYEEAVGHFEMALQTLDPIAEPQEELRCELLLGLGTALGAAGDRTKSHETFVQAADVARAVGDAEKLAEAALGLGRLSDEPFEPPRNSQGPLVPLLEEALAALPAHDSPLRARLLSRLGTTICWETESRELRRSLVREAVEMAERLGDSGALIAALIDKRIPLMCPGGAEERLADATRILRLAAQNGDQERELQAREARLFDLLELGEAAAADVEIERIEELARALRQPRYVADAEMIRAMRTLMDGRLDEGGELAERSLAMNQQVRPEIAVTLYGSQMFRTAWREKGRFAELETGMKAILDQMGPMPAANSGLAFVRSEQGKTKEARAEFERIAADDFTSLPREVMWTTVMANLTEVCCHLGDLPRARVLYEQLLPFAAMNVVLGVVPHACWGPIAHFLGMLAAVIGEKKKAAEHFEYALAMEEKLRMPAVRARTLYEYGSVLLRSDRPDQAKKGAELLGAAIETARSLGMKVLADKISALLAESRAKIVGVTEARTAPDSAHDLFRREGQYWTIKYQGRTFRLRHAKGLAYLAELLGNPGREFLALDLARFAGEHAEGDCRRAESVFSISSDSGDAGPLLDFRAKAQYRQRLEDLREELREAERANDSERAALAREEIEFLAGELARATGLGGRDRRAAAAVERARQSVTIAIRTALKRIAENDPALGRYLAYTVRTGRFCAYTPDPHIASYWRV